MEINRTESKEAFQRYQTIVEKGLKLKKEREELERKRNSHNHTSSFGENLAGLDEHSESVKNI